MTKKSILASILVAAMLWAQALTPTATIAQDPTTGIVTAVESTSKKSRIVCKYTPQPAPPAIVTGLNINCVVNGAPAAAYYVQFSHPFAPPVQGATFGINANGNMAVTAIFTPVAAVAPGTATNHIGYQIAANSAFSQGTF
jgi:hypothetical protein